MPYISKKIVSVEQSKAVSGEEVVKSGERQQRVTPSYVDSDPKAVSKFVPQAGTEGFTLDDKRHVFMKMLLKINVEKIRTEDGAQPAEPDKPPFNKYTIKLNEKNLEKMGNRCRVVKATHADYPEAGMVAKIFDNGLSEEKIPNPLYLKMLRQVGKKHPYVLSTWDIFDKGGMIIIIQEFANRYDVGSFLSKYGQQEEAIICQWARQLYKAMDFLGDMGICHRGIKPRRVLLVNSDLQVRLTGFYDAVIYWDPQKEDIINFPCIPSTKKSRDMPDYQAPEVYGDETKEEFDPIIADIWSYGAVVYFMATLAYPHDVKKENPKIEDELQGNVQKVVKGSPQLVSLLSQLLTTNAMMRLTFERIGRHPWFHDVFPVTAAVIAGGVVGPGGSISGKSGGKVAPVSVVTAAGKSDAVTHGGKSAPASKVGSKVGSKLDSKLDFKLDSIKSNKSKGGKIGSYQKTKKLSSKIVSSSPSNSSSGGSSSVQVKIIKSKVVQSKSGKSKITKKVKSKMSKEKGSKQQAQQSSSSSSHTTTIKISKVSKEGGGGGDESNK